MSAAKILRLENVRKSYLLGQTKVHALKGVSLEVLQGDFACLIGPSGSGKSTLLNIIGTLDSPDEGRVEIDGQETSDMNEDRLCELRNRKIGFVFQSFNLIPVLTVVENVELPLVLNREMTSGQRRERVLQALRDVDLEKYHSHLPDQISGGQRQRVALARALAPGPSLVLADEPTANLDSKTTHQIIDLLLDLNARKQVTFLFCSHDEKLVGRSQKIFQIQDGLLKV